MPRRRGLANRPGGRHPTRMHLPSPQDLPDSPSQRQADRRRWLRAFNLSLAFALVLMAVFSAQGQFDARAWAVRPGLPHGLWGVFTAPLLHGSVEHLATNVMSLLMLGTLALGHYPRATWRGLPLMWLGSGLGAWWLGSAGSHHLGASGLTHGLMFLLLGLGLLRRDKPSVAAAMIAFMLYGGMLLTVLPREPGVSWQAHLGGAFGGAVAGWLWRRSDPLPPRQRYSWEVEEELAPAPPGELDMPSPREVPVLWHRPPPDTERGVVLRFPGRDRDAS